MTESGIKNFMIFVQTTLFVCVLFGPTTPTLFSIYLVAFSKPEHILHRIGYFINRKQE